MHGETDAYHMLRLHSTLAVNKDMTISELEKMIPFEREAFLTVLIEEKNKINKVVQKIDIHPENDIRDRM